MITLIWPRPGSAEIGLPPLRSWRFPEHAGDQPVRNLTVRSLDRARGWLTIDFFMHDEDGPASG
jgi:NADPH-dependent ferric siderophore reductase